MLHKRTALSLFASLALAGAAMAQATDSKPALTQPAKATPAKGQPEKVNPKEKVDQIKKEKEAEIQKAKEHGEKKMQEAKKEAEKKMQGAKTQMASLKVGDAAPTFSLVDTDGKTTDLAALLKDGDKIVVLEWYNPDCPFVKKHHEKNKTFADLHTKFKDKGVVFLAINSGAKGEQGFGQERNAKAKKDNAIEYPILLDESGTVGRSYGAQRTPHMFVIGKTGKIEYQGAIDDDSSVDTPGKTNYVDKALTELLAGTSVTTTETKAYGCTVKYAKN